MPFDMFLNCLCNTMKSVSFKTVSSFQSCYVFLVGTFPSFQLMMKTAVFATASSGCLPHKKITGTKQCQFSNQWVTTKLLTLSLPPFLLVLWQGLCLVTCHRWANLYLCSNKMKMSEEGEAPLRLEIFLVIRFWKVCAFVVKSYYESPKAVAFMLLAKGFSLARAFLWTARGHSDDHCWWNLDSAFNLMRPEIWRHLTVPETV